MTTTSTTTIRSEGAIAIDAAPASRNASVAKALRAVADRVENSHEVVVGAAVNVRPGTSRVTFTITQGST